MIDIEATLEEIKSMLAVLVEREPIKDHYEIEEFARLVAKAPFMVREWARLRRIQAEKRHSCRGEYPGWVLAHTELEQ